MTLKFGLSQQSKNDVFKITVQHTDSEVTLWALIFSRCLTRYHLT